MPRVALPVDLDAQTRKTLDKFVNSTSTPESLALRSRIVLTAADGSTNQQIAAALKIPPITVGKWRRSFALQGFEGLRDAPRSGRPPSMISRPGRRCTRAYASNRTIKALDRTYSSSRIRIAGQHCARHAGCRQVATASHADVYLQPRPDFEAKLLDIVGLYLNPPLECIRAVRGREA